jgi:hypothetical protein
MVLPGQGYRTSQEAVIVNGGIMISRGKEKNLEENHASLAISPPQISHEVIRG